MYILGVCLGAIFGGIFGFGGYIWGAILTCERGLALLAARGARGGGGLVQLQLSLHRQLWDGQREVLAPRASHQAGTLPAAGGS